MEKYEVCKKEKKNEWKQQLESAENFCTGQVVELRQGKDSAQARSSGPGLCGSPLKRAQAARESPGFGPTMFLCKIKGLLCNLWPGLNIKISS